MNIMNENFCSYGSKRDELLAAYIYDEMVAEDRVAFDRHLLACAPCRAELDALGDVRSQLARWAPPDLTGHVSVRIGAPPSQRSGIVNTMRVIPLWAQVAAATLILGAAAGLANLDISYTPEGLSVRTGWRHPAQADSRRASAPDGSATVGSMPWRGDLAALEQELRAALDARPAAQPARVAAMSDDAVLRRVRQLIQESERRQQSELALRVGAVARDIQTQRQADLVKIDRSLGLIQSRTGMEVLRTQRQVNSLAQQVSQRP